MLQKFIHSICAFASVLILNGQNGIFSSPNWYIKPAYNQGIILEHRATIGHLVKGYPSMYELNIVKPSSGNRLWHHENNFPDLGLSLNVIDFKNPSQLGYSFSLAPFAEIPLNKTEKASRLILRLSWGLAYLNKKFDVETNHKNIAIGSHFNSYVQFKWFWQLQLNKRLRFEPGFSFTHASNAKMKTPNLGLNVACINLALNFNATNKTTVYLATDSSKSIRTPKHEFFFWSTIGINDREPTIDKKRFTLTNSFNFFLNKRNTHKFGLGFDFYYDENMIDDMVYEGLAVNTLADVWRGGPKFCYAYNLGQISFPIEMGAYVRTPYKGDGLFFHRIGVRYLSKKGIAALVNLRTHWGVAYAFEFGLGYRIGFGKK
jgi:hypothetical protein